MAEKITYYGHYWPGRAEPTGLTRRRETADGFRDETLHRDLQWHHSSTTIEWKRGDTTEDLVEISEEEANRLIERFRQRWGTSSA